MTQSPTPASPTDTRCSDCPARLAEKPTTTPEELRRICMRMHLGAVTVEDARTIRELAKYLERQQ